MSHISLHCKYPSETIQATTIMKTSYKKKYRMIAIDENNIISLRF